jgi:hypothetical protein
MNVSGYTTIKGIKTQVNCMALNSTAQKSSILHRTQTKWLKIPFIWFSVIAGMCPNAFCNDECKVPLLKRSPPLPVDNVEFCAT